MASSYDFFLTESIDSAKAHVDAVLREQGFTLTSSPDGGLVAERGSMGLTVLFGAMAGKSMHMRFTVQFFADDQQRIVARLNRNLGSGMAKGGAIGAAKTSSTFQNLANALGTALHATGALVDTKEN